MREDRKKRGVRADLWCGTPTIRGWDIDDEPAEEAEKGGQTGRRRTRAELSRITKT